MVKIQKCPEVVGAKRLFKSEFWTGRVIAANEVNIPAGFFVLLKDRTDDVGIQVRAGLGREVEFGEVDNDDIASDMTL